MNRSMTSLRFKPVTDRRFGGSQQAWIPVAFSRIVI